MERWTDGCLRRCSLFFDKEQYLKDIKDIIEVLGIDVIAAYIFDVAGTLDEDAFLRQRAWVFHYALNIFPWDDDFLF